MKAKEIIATLLAALVVVHYYAVTSGPMWRDAYAGETFLELLWRRLPLFMLLGGCWPLFKVDFFRWLPIPLLAMVLFHVHPILSEDLGLTSFVSKSLLMLAFGVWISAAIELFTTTEETVLWKSQHKTWQYVDAGWTPYISIAFVAVSLAAWFTLPLVEVNQLSMSGRLLMHVPMLAAAAFAFVPRSSHGYYVGILICLILVTVISVSLANLFSYPLGNVKEASYVHSAMEHWPFALLAVTVIGTGWLGSNYYPETKKTRLEASNASSKLQQGRVQPATSRLLPSATRRFGNRKRSSNAD
ncbi:hypothetical protein [Kordiimonas lacus]|uniref:Uncharacterized protein n=1 Tax=Kordiimonas lacus TaxID=637679 RepID=A0A1G7CB76_9PROT|nr:hypothetical protein [Kordiimonas lacus]SDE36587.1 hypothetical protein SAMN04488071_2732 [Kordiimonas lacus]